MKVIAHLDDLPAARRIFIYGAGGTGLILNGVLGGVGLDTIAGYIDSYATGKRNYFPCYSPEEFMAIARPDDLVLIASIHYREIAATLDRLGFENYYGANFLVGFYTTSEAINHRKFLDAHLPAGATVYDIGANEGALSALCARKAKQVVGFEPNPNMLDLARANTSALSHVEIFPYAVSDQEGRASLSLDTGHHASLGSSLVTSFGSSIEVETVTIDAFAARHGSAPSFIKIDAEGHDAAVLRGAREVIAKHRPLIVVESGLDPDIVEELRRSYRLVRIPNTFDVDYFDRDRPVTGTDFTGSCNIACFPL